MIKYLLRHTQQKPISFHMPGHKGSAIYRKYGYGDFLDNIMDCDITEIPGADNLFQTEGIIKEVQDRYSRLYDAKSYLLINGTSAGIIASILATVKQGEKLIMARNCHKSVFNAVVLAGAVPVYAYPTLIEDWGLSGEVTAQEIEKLLKENKDAAAVILPSPNYYGICSDIQAISEVVHKYGKVMIVDQAHGAHLRFFNRYCQSQIYDECSKLYATCPKYSMPLNAEAQGADIVINSIHKTLASFTQSAVINLCGNNVREDVIKDKLQAIQSTSPSYLLMASLDISGKLLEKNGSELLGQWNENLQGFYEASRDLKALKVLCNWMEIEVNFDYSKINIDTSKLGISGIELEKMLNEKYNIYPELTTGNLVMFMTGIGNKKEDFDKLLEALQDIENIEINLGAKNTNDVLKGSNLSKNKKLISPKSVNRVKIYPIPSETEYINLNFAEGKICASSLIPYPPGIPYVCPGEKISQEAIDYLKTMRDSGEKVIGINEDGEVLVGKYK